MRLFLDTSLASPFCSCRTHALPPVSPEIEEAWQSIPGETYTNSLAAADTIDDETADLPAFSKLERDTLELPPRASPEYFSSISPCSSPRSIGSPLFSDLSDSIGWSDYTTDNTTSSSYKAAAPSRDKNSEVDLEIAAHSLYGRTIKALYDPSYDAESMIHVIETGLKAAHRFNGTKLRATLRSMTLKSFHHVWQERSALWHTIERSIHSEQATCFTSTSEMNYGVSACHLASFTGALFAAGVLNFQDLQDCINTIRNVSTRLALHALRSIIWGAGDRACRTKNAAYMEALYVEFWNRAMESEVVWDAEAQILLLNICQWISYHFQLQKEKRERAVTKIPSKSKPRKTALASWSCSSV